MHRRPAPVQDKKDKPSSRHTRDNAWSVEKRSISKQHWPDFLNRRSSRCRNIKVFKAPSKLQKQNREYK
jgi:hypothetical protein